MNEDGHPSREAAEAVQVDAALEACGPVRMREMSPVLAGQAAGSRPHLIGCQGPWRPAVILQGCRNRTLSTTATW